MTESRSMRIAHISDLHVLELEGVKPWRFLNKRLTGYANLRLKRGHIHRPAYVRALAKAMATANVDHLVISGDLTNLGLETEFEAVRALLEEELHLDAEHVTVVPGNHDVYTRGAARSGRFGTYFRDYLKSDLPELVAPATSPFPVVKLRGPAAIVGISSAIPKLPFFSAGRVGHDQMAALLRILEHPEVRKRTPVLALHHPPHNPPSWLKSTLRGLSDAPEFLRVLEGLPRGLVLYGHLHVRRQIHHVTREGRVHTVGATSASLHHEDEHRMAGFNVYDIDASGEVTKVSATVFDPAASRFHERAIPVHA